MRQVVSDIGEPLSTAVSAPDFGSGDAGSNPAGAAPYLILHKVRGEPAFDIAIKLDIGDEQGWIIPTSGHRAYPSWWMPLNRITVNPDNRADIIYLAHAVGIPDDWPDHYEHSREPKGILYHTTARELLKRLGFGEPAMKRRKLG